MYKISIIVPVFNVEDTIENAFDSILNQSMGFENLEVIFVDDKSTDNSANIIKELSSNPPKTLRHFIMTRTAVFAGKSRNIGIENSTPVISYDIHYGPADCIIHVENRYIIRQGDFEGLAKCMLDMWNNPDNAIETDKISHQNVLKQISEEDLFMKCEDVLKESYMNLQDSQKTI